jgi:hypothetical protein
MAYATNTSGRAGSWTATGTSSIIVPANAYRDHLFLQYEIAQPGGVQVALGFGEDAVAGQGAQFYTGGSILTIHGPEARKAIYGLASGGTGTGYFQTGEVIAFTY